MSQKLSEDELLQLNKSVHENEPLAKRALFVIKGKQESKSYRDKLPIDIKQRLDELDKSINDNAANKNLDNSNEDNTGDSRFYHRVQMYRKKYKLTKDKDKAKSTLALIDKLKIWSIIVVLFALFYLYNEYFFNQDINTFEQLQKALPIKIDEHTTFESLEFDENGNISMLFIKDKDAYSNLSEQEKEATLNNIVLNAQALCTNDDIYAIVEKGKALIVSLTDEDKSFYREFKITKCTKK